LGISVAAPEADSTATMATAITQKTVIIGTPLGGIGILRFKCGGYFAGRRKSLGMH
jgi:hypothetical protein